MNSSLKATSSSSRDSGGLEMEFIFRQAISLAFSGIRARLSLNPAEVSLDWVKSGIDTAGTFCSYLAPF
jgi:hypothetical protein